MYEFKRSNLDSLNSVEFPSRSGSCSDLESPLESSAAISLFSDSNSAKVTIVDIRGQSYRAPARLSKQFYLDLTYMEDEELISTYALVKYTKHKRASSSWTYASVADFKQ